MMSKATITFFIYFLLITNVLAQKKDIEIRVVSDNQPVEFADIFFPKLKTGAVSDSLGVAIIRNISLGKQAVEVSFVGYERYSEVLNVASEKAIFTINIKPLNAALSEVVVTGNLKEMRKLESIVPVELYSPKFFERNPTPSLFEAMSSVNGVRPQLQCSVCNTGDIHINGMEGPYTMVLIDNMPIVSGLSTVYGLSGIPNAIVERIEVVKGPAAALYGSEAMGGIINVITKNPNNSPRFALDLNGNSYQEWNADVATSFKIGRKIKTLASANYYHFNKRFDINDDNFTDITLAKRLAAFNKWNVQRKSNRVADLAFRYINEARFGGELQWTPVFRGTDSIYGEAINTHRYEILGNYQLPIEGEKVMFNFSANRHIQDSDYGNVNYFADQNIVFSQLTWDEKIGKNHDFLLGVGHRYTYYDDNTALTATADGIQNQPQRKTLTGAFVQDEISPNERVKMVVGLRYDYSNVHKHIVSPRLGFKYKLNTFNALRLNVGNGFRVVNVFSEDHAALTGGRKVEFINDLQPERSWNGNLNYTHFHSLDNGFVNLDVSAFYTFYNNKIVADYLTDANKIIYDNLQGYAQNYGLSLNSDWTFENGLKSTIGATLLESYLYENGKKQAQIQTPNLTTNYSFSYHFYKKDILLDFNGYITSPMLLPTLPNDYRPSQSPWFNISNVQVTKKWATQGIELYGGVKNLFGFYPKEDIIMRAFDPFDKKINSNNPNGYTFDPSYNYAPMQRARFFLGLRLRLK